MSARRRWLVAFALAVLAAVVAAAGFAFYVATSTAGSSGRARAAFLPTGSQPTVSVSGRDVTVSWAQSSVAALGGLLGAQAHGGYTITRYAEDAPSTAITPDANCSGTRSGSSDPLTCTENSLPTGRWKYTATPSYYNWIGGESSQSLHAIIAPAAPTTITLANGGGVGSAYINSANKSSLTINVALPATSLSSDTVSLSLSDGAHSPVTASTPATSGAGSVSFTGVDVSGLSDGSITISATSSSSYGDASSATQITRTKDTVAPVVHATAGRVPDSNGWYNHSVTFSASTSTDTGGSGIQSCDADVAYSAPDTAGDSRSFTCTDAAGNSASDSISFKYDGTNPADSLTLGASPSHALLSGTNLYYKGNVTGSFSIVDTVGDATSGPASATFPVFNTLGWTGAGGNVATPSGGPYTSAYSWLATQTLSPTTGTVSSADSAGNQSSGTTLSLVNDTTAPGGLPAFSVNGTAATSGGSTSTSTSASYSITGRVDFTEVQSSTQSGLHDSTLTIQSETLTGSTCGAPGSGGAYTSPMTISGTANPSIVAGFCYLYTLTGTDNVGNAASLSTRVTVYASLTVPFSSAGSHTLTIPAGVTSVSFTLVGGGGGASGTTPAGGAGASISGTITLASNPSGTTLTVVVGGGGTGGSGGAGATTGYGTGGAGGTGSAGGAGGGAGSAIETSSLTVIVVAAGGGGTGGIRGTNGSGGTGGAGGVPTTLSSTANTGATGGTGTGSGAGGTGGSTNSGGVGTNGAGGSSANGTAGDVGGSSAGGGGGGGGYAGGAGGDSNSGNNKGGGGGGGGSSYTAGTAGFTVTVSAAGSGSGTQGGGGTSGGNGNTGFATFMGSGITGS